MTLKELSQLYHLNREIEKAKEKLKKLRAKAQSPGSFKLSDLPSCKETGSKTENYALKIAELDEIISAKKERCIDEKIKLMKYISDIDDSLTRQIFELRFVEGKSWPQVAHNLRGSNTEGSVKMICYRYIRLQNRKNSKK